jgi:hypothetical protein
MNNQWYFKMFDQLQVLESLVKAVHSETIEMPLFKGQQKHFNNQEAHS